MIKIALTYPAAIIGEENRIQSLLDEDVDVVHLRKPAYDRGMMIDLIRSISPLYHNRLVIHSHYDLCEMFQLKGIALNERAMCDVSNETGNKYPLVSYSAHSFQDIELLTVDPEYIFLSPIFDSISKSGYTSAFRDHDTLSRFLAGSQHKVIALGGVDDSKIQAINELGFAGYAQLGNIWQRQMTTV